MTNRTERVGFIGLGVMGSAMAKHLLVEGFSLAVYDINKSKSSALAQNNNCLIAETPAEVMKLSSRLIIMLPNSDQVDNVLFSDKGIVSEINPGDVILEMSTGNIFQLEQQAQRIESQKAIFIDAPVCLSPAEAALGQLISLVGGDLDAVEKADKILASLSQRVIHAGPVGFGLRLKLINNYMSMVNHVLTGEVLALAKAVGLDRSLTVDLLQNTAAGRGQLRTNYPKKVLKGDTTADFSIDMGIKDLSMSISMLREFHDIVSFGIIARNHFSEAAEAGYGSMDCTTILEYFDAKISSTHN